MARSAAFVLSSMNFTRDLSNEPGNYLTPRVLADKAASLASVPGITAEILDEKKIAELREILAGLPVTLVCTPASGSIFAIGTQTVTCTATDAAGNTGSASFTIRSQNSGLPRPGAEGTP